MTGAIKKWEDYVSFVEDYTKGTLKKTWTKNMEKSNNHDHYFQPKRITFHI